MLKLMRNVGRPPKYSSTPTRNTSLQFFMGGAEINEHHEHNPDPTNQPENLEAKFNSGVNRTDVPRMWGHPSVDRYFGTSRKLSLAQDVKNWRRQKGEPLYE